MGRSKLKPLIENLLVVDIAAEGKAIARHEGMVIFISNCVPGDMVDVQVVRKRKRYMEGYPVKYHAYSEHRAKPFCSHFGICGGCKWQHLPYPSQLKYKQKQVTDDLTRIGKVEIDLVNPILASESQTHYRNKLEFTFSHNRWLTADEIESGIPVEERKALGFHIPGKFDKVLDIETCYLQPEPSNRIRNFIRRYALDNELDFFDLTRQSGFLRNLIIRNTLAGEFMVILCFFRDDPESIEKLLHATASEFPEIRSLMYVINPKGNDTIQDLEVKCYSGGDHLVEYMEGLKFRISPKSFFQTNSRQAYQLYRVVRDFAALTGSETVYDLYTGTGTIALFLAALCKKMIGIEYVREAIEDAGLNAQDNGINNVSFFAGDIRVLMNTSFMTLHGYPDVVVTDPPRTGMHEDVTRAILAARPEKIVYVSCNSATQARDLQLLSECYQVSKIQPVDMFPYTQHVENVAQLCLR